MSATNTEKDKNIRVQKLSDDLEYYNNVFKGTEGVIGAIFYILSETKVTPQVEPHITLIRDKAFSVHETSLKTLTLQHHQQTAGLEQLRYELVALESTLRIAHVSQVLPLHIFTLLVEQIDAVLRYLNHHYLSQRTVSVGDFMTTSPAKAATRPTATRADHAAPLPAKRQRRAVIPAGDISSDAYLVYSQLTDRAARIKTVLEAKPQATIKDIAEIITDVSEKTIQRELNSLIDRNEVVREGERRWSRYSVAK